MFKTEQFSMTSVSSTKFSELLECTVLNWIKNVGKSNLENNELFQEVNLFSLCLHAFGSWQMKRGKTCIK